MSLSRRSLAAGRSDDRLEYVVASLRLAAPRLRTKDRRAVVVVSPARRRVSGLARCDERGAFEDCTRRLAHPQVFDPMKERRDIPDDGIASNVVLKLDQYSMLI